MTTHELAASVRCELLREGGSPASAESLLLVVGYGTRPGAHSDGGVPCLEVSNRVLAPGPVVELWRSLHTVRRGRIGALEWSEDGEVLAACLRSRPGEDLVAATHDHFRELLAVSLERGYPYLLRVWNYLPRINDGAVDDERYRLFNIGRERAFSEFPARRGAEARLPASSAVGTPGEEIRTALLASTRSPLWIENPRQVSAYRYPTRYGPQPPSFSRATLLSSPSLDAFFLSGTASIVGHETRHAGSLRDQVEETLRNIDSLVGNARGCPGGRWLPAPRDFDLLKIYLRHAEQLPALRTALDQLLGADTPVLILEAEICRSDLLVEIEGLTFR